MEPNRYQQGKIYKIVSPHTDKIYIGSTTKQYLSQRLAKHKSDFKRWQQGKARNITSFNLIELGDVEIILLELYPCNSKDELTSRERHWYNLNKELVINKLRPSFTLEERKKEQKEYYQNNYEYIQEYYKKYRESRKDELIQYSKEYRKIKFNCECGSKNISYEHKASHNKTDKHQTYLMIQTL